MKLAKHVTELKNGTYSFRVGMFDEYGRGVKRDVVYLDDYKDLKAENERLRAFLKDLKDIAPELTDDINELLKEQS